MRSLGGVIVLLIVLAIAGFAALRETLGVAPAMPAASGALPPAPVERAQAAQQRAAENVSRALDAASASRDAAENR